MRYSTVLLIGVCAATSVWAQVAPGKEVQGRPARPSPADYQAKAVAGTVTIAADFVGHSVPTDQNPLTTEDYVVAEVAFFGPDGARLTLAASEFSIRINAKKSATPSQPYGFVLKTLKDPEWVPPAPPEGSGPKSKGGLSSGGGGGGGAAGDPKPAEPKMPFPLKRLMEQKAQKSALPEGDRALPQGGLVFFPYRGKATGIKQLELIYEGPAGKATLTFEF